jgi:hypothetical protein
MQPQLAPTHLHPEHVNSPGLGGAVDSEIGQAWPQSKRFRLFGSQQGKKGVGKRRGPVVPPEAASEKD